jgi:hypothetical protein
MPYREVVGEYEREFVTWRRKRLMNRIRIASTLCAGVAVLLTIWCHVVIEQPYCAQSTITCWEFNHVNSWYWSYWSISCILALSIMGAATVLAMIVIWFSRFSLRLFLRGPMVSVENRLAFIRWFCVIFVFTIISSAVNYCFAYPRR